MGELLRGRAWRFGDDVNTDIIIPGKYKFKTLDMKELACHAMEGLDPQFTKKVAPGDFIVAGRNFGCGSSREHAPRVLKELGLSAVVAGSFARIFFRNSINVGFPLLESPPAVTEIRDGALLEVDLGGGSITDLTTGRHFSFKPLPPFLLKILEAGGLIPFFKEHRGFPPLQ